MVLGIRRMEKAGMARWIRVAFVVCFGLIWASCGSDTSPEEAETVIVGRQDDTPELDGPYTEEAIQDILDNFSWFDAPLVDEYRADDEPLFYYVEVLATEDEIDELFTQNGLPWDLLPLFDEELEALGIGTHAVEVIDIAGIEEGQVVFTILPGEVVNIIVSEERQAEEEGDDVVGFLRLREIPSPYRTSENTVKPEIFYDAFDFEKVDNTSLEDTILSTHPTHDFTNQARFKFFKSIARGIRNAARKIGRGVQKAVGTLRPRRDVNIIFELNEWGSWNQDDGPYRLQRAWGKDAGKHLMPRGILVGVNTGIAARQEGRLNADGLLKLRVPQGYIRFITLDLRNHAADISRTGFHTRILRIAHGAGTRGNQTVFIIDPHQLFTSLAVFTDAYDYSSETFDIKPKRASVAAPNVNKKNSAVVATSLLDSAHLRRTYVRKWLGLAVNSAVPADILIAKSDHVDREVLYHEYGHWVLANILSKSNRKHMTDFWGLTISDVLREESMYADVYSTVPHEVTRVMRMINEGFADFFVIQTFGVANYGGALSNGVEGNCDLLTNKCYEDNVGSDNTYYYNGLSVMEPRGEIDFPQDIKWNRLNSLHRRITYSSGGSTFEMLPIINRGATIISTFLVDMVDGNTDPNLSSGALWTYKENGERSLRSEPWRYHLRDESVALTGVEVREALGLWMNRLDPEDFVNYTYDSLLHDSFAEAFGEVARRRHSRSDVCLVFALHSPERSCPQLGEEAAQSWLELLPPRESQVFAARSFGQDNALIFVSWNRLGRRGDFPVIRLFQDGVFVEEAVGSSVPLHIFGKNLRFDTTYTVELSTQRGDRESDPIPHDVRTLAERPHSLHTE